MEPQEDLHSRRITRRAMVRVAGIAVLAGFAFAASPLWRRWTRPAPGHCPFCHRHEHNDSLVTFRAAGEDPTDACCLSCALSYGRQSGKAITVLAVTDHTTGARLDPGQAMFVIGSDVSPCTQMHAEAQVGPDGQPRAVRWDRCLPSVLAFNGTLAAEAFRHEHGGHLGSFAEVRRELDARAAQTG